MCDSILAQSFSDFQLILVDDGSPDNCGMICDQYAQGDSRIHVIHQKNGGLSAARNTGLDYITNSDSQWITFIDSDDWTHPDYLKVLYDTAVRTDLPLIICGFVWATGAESEISSYTPDLKIWIPEDFFVEENTNATIAWGKLYRKELFNTLRYPNGLIHEDEFTTYKILFSQKKVAVTTAPLYYYFLNQSGIVRSSWNPQRLSIFNAFDEQLQFYKKHGFERALKKRTISYGHVIETQLQQISTSDFARQTKFIRLLRKKARTILRKYKEFFTPFDSFIWMYELSHPVSMKFYWYYRSILRKLKIK